jgi:hypothetical protein
MQFRRKAMSKSTSVPGKGNDPRTAKLAMPCPDFPRGDAVRAKFQEAQQEDRARAQGSEARASVHDGRDCRRPVAAIILLDTSVAF